MDRDPGELQMVRASPGREVRGGTGGEGPGFMRALRGPGPGRN